MAVATSNVANPTDHISSAIFNSFNSEWIPPQQNHQTKSTDAQAHKDTSWTHNEMQESLRSARDSIKNKDGSQRQAHGHPQGVNNRRPCWSRWILWVTCLKSAAYWQKKIVMAGKQAWMSTGLALSTTKYAWLFCKRTPNHDIGLKVRQADYWGTWVFSLSRLGALWI